MVLRLKRNPIIEDRRKHGPEVVARLRQLLESGAPARPDPKRKNFYELEAGSSIFYIHISPITGRVSLLATWLRECLRPGKLRTAGQAA